jgi:septum formation topological specificity factor MinE
MPTSLEDLRNAMNQFLVSAVETNYHTSKPDLEQVKNDLIKIIEQYIKEQKENDMRKDS